MKDIRVKLDFSEDLGHEICLGIRKGLYGSGAEDSADIRDVMYGIVEKLESMAVAIDGLANQVSGLNYINITNLPLQEEE